MKKIFFVLLATVLLSAGCGSSDQVIVPKNQPVTDQQKQIKPIANGYSTAEAMKYLFGNYDNKTERSEWILSKADLDAINSNKNIKLYDVEVGYPFTVKAYASTTTPEGDFLLLTHTDTGPASHVDGSLIGGFLFHKSEQGWVPKIQQKAFLEAGVYGEPPAQVTAIQYGKNAYGFELLGEDIHQGFVDSYIILVAPVKEKFSKLLHYWTGGSNDGSADGPTYSFDSNISFVPVKGSDYFNLRIITTGTDLDSARKHLINVNQKYNFSFKNGIYKEIKN